METWNTITADVDNFKTKYAASLHNCKFNSAKRKKMPRKSIIRKIGVHLTWIKVQRFHFVWREGLSGRSSEFDENELSKSLCLCTDLVIEEDKAVRPWERKMEDLEKELLNLRSEVAKLLLLQETKMSIKAQVHLNSESEVSSSTSEMLPPRPPPPPPPLPPTPITPKKLPLVRVKVKANTPSDTPTQDSTSSIMEELAKRPPKLRHVERSPGGRPVRTPLKTNSPADKLAAILRKRFEAIHSPTQDPYMISPRSSPKTPELFGH